jgi:hypothetical protein
MMVFALIPSPIKYQVSILNTTIPEPNPMNLTGHNNPSKCRARYLVPNINRYDIIPPKATDNIIGFFLNHSHTN